VVLSAEALLGVPINRGLDWVRSLGATVGSSAPPPRWSFESVCCAYYDNPNFSTEILHNYRLEILRSVS